MGLVARDSVDTDVRRAQRRVTQFLGRFHPSVRGEVRAFARSGPRRLDLAAVCPGAAVAIVTRSAGIAASHAATRLVDEGAALKEVERILALPSWLRRLPPEAFAGPLERAPDDEVLARRIAAVLPRSRIVAADWLSSTLFAYDTVGMEFAVWIARQPIHAEMARSPTPIRMLAAYAWFSSHPELAAARSISSRWRPDLSFDTALGAAKMWFNRLALQLLLGRTPIQSTWLQAGTAGGMTFEPLLSADALLAEAKAMCNCIDQYAKRLVQDRCRLFSVRLPDGRSVATVEVGQHPREAGFLSIVQLKGRHNSTAPLEVWRAAYAWLGQQKVLNRSPLTPATPRLIDNALWGSLMAPYWEAQGPRVALPRQLTWLILEGLDLELIELARRGRINSWLFM